jgi:hypothetical protein
LIRKAHLPRADFLYQGSGLQRSLAKSVVRQEQRGFMKKMKLAVLMSETQVLRQQGHIAP